MKTLPYLLAALLLLNTVGCESETPTETPSEKAPALNTETQPAESPRDDDKAKQPQKQERDEAPETAGPKGEAPDPAPLETELEAMHAEADTTLMEDPDCEGFSDLRKCQRHDMDEDWEKAARCFGNFVVVGGPDKCRAAQFVKAAAYYDRANKPEAATKARLEIVEITDEPTAASIAAADHLIESGDIDRARTLYADFAEAHPDIPLKEYVDAQCARIGGCAE